MRGVGWRLLGLGQLRGLCMSAGLVVPGGPICKSSAPISYSKSRYSKAVERALQTYLCRRQGLSSEDAAFVSANSPNFLKKLENVAAEKCLGDASRSSKALVDCHLAAFLERTGVDDMELFLESMRVSSVEFGEVLGFQRTLGGDAGLLASVAVFESIGVPRKKLSKLFLQEKELLKLTPVDLNHSFLSLNRIGIDQKLVPLLLQTCPSVLGWDLEKALDLMLLQLEEWGIKKQVLAYFVKSKPHDLIKLSKVDFLEFKSKLSHFGLSNSQIARIVQNFPSVLVEFSEDCLAANANILRESGLLDAEIGKVIVRLPRMLLTNEENFLHFNVHYLRSMGLEQRSIARFVLRHTKLMAERIEDSLEPKIKFFTSLGLEREHFKNFILSYFTLTKCSLEKNFIPKLAFLETLGMDKRNVAELVIKFPSFFGYSLEPTWKQKIQFLKDLGVDREKVCKVILRYPAIITCSIEHNMKPKVEFLKSVGFYEEDITKLVILRPSFLGSSTKSLTEKLNFLRDLGFVDGSHELIRALGCLFAMRRNMLDERVVNLMSLGLTRNDVCTMVRDLPTLLQLRNENLKAKVDYLINTMRYSLGKLPRFPQFLTYSLEGRIKPRYRVLSWLQGHGLLKQEFNMMHGYLHTEAIFMKKYVNVHPGALAIYRGSKSELPFP